MSDAPEYNIRVDEGPDWTTVSEFSEYDAIHVVAGAILAGADKVEVTKGGDDDE